MGAFYGSIHARASAPSELVLALRRVANMEFFVAEERNGWSAIYPSGSGQDTELTRQLAAQIRTPLVHIVVHDGDVFNYVVHRGGQLVDEYSSVPDYFGPVDDETLARLKGRPKNFADLLKADVTPREVASILDRARGVGASSTGPATWDLEARVRNVEQEVDRIRSSTEWRDVRRELRDQAAAFLGYGATIPPDEEIVIGLSQHSDPEARAVLESYQKKLLDLLHRSTSSYETTAGLDSDRLDAEQAASMFAVTLAIEDALGSYEYLVEQDVVASMLRGRALIHVTGQSVP